MAKIDAGFAHDIFLFLHKPIRDIDRTEGEGFVERFLIGPQNNFELTQKTINELKTLNNPATIRADLLQYLKSHVGFTDELNNITNGLSDNDLRKLISLAVALWKTKGTEVGYKSIIRLFTGKNARVFDWFDFRMIVGETSFGEEQLGEDAWLISKVAVGKLEDVANNVVSLLTMEDNLKDRSLGRNDATKHGEVNFYDVPTSGFPQTSTKYAALDSAVIRQPHSSRYNLSGSFTIEMYLKMDTEEANAVLFHKRVGGVGVKIEVDKSANEISFELDDGANTVTGTLTAVLDIDDDIPRHLALVVDRANDGARLYYNGTESTAKIALGVLGDVSNGGAIFLGGSNFGVDLLQVDIDEFRLALNAVYDVDTGTLLAPISGFIPFQEEQLDEYISDVRLVDEGDLNKTLILRILNLMRPVSERLNVIFISFFDDFFDGTGQWLKFSVGGGVSVNTTSEMRIEPDTLMASTVLDDDLFENIIYQTKLRVSEDTVGGEASVLFALQDLTNYYEYKVDFITKVVKLFKVVGGVPTQIGGDLPEDLVFGASYILTVTATTTLTGDTLIKTYVDSNTKHEVTDSAFTNGKLGLKSGTDTTTLVDEIEMFELPLDVQKILPNFNL